MGYSRNREKLMQQADQVTLPSAGDIPFRVSAQPPPFKATGRGWFNKLPQFPANAHNANASLINLATGKNDLRKIYLFVDAVETGWTLAGETSQSQSARAFYPRNLAQDDLVIEGTVASQYDYDLLVRFVLHHQHSQFTLSALSGTNQLPGEIQYGGVIFQLFKPHNSKISTFPYMRYMVAITAIQSGHQQGQMAGIPFQLTCKVVYDYLGPQIDTENQVKKLASISAIFGDVSNPQPGGTWESVEGAITTSAQVTTATQDGSSLAAKAIAND